MMRGPIVWLALALSDALHGPILARSHLFLYFLSFTFLPHIILSFYVLYCMMHYTANFGKVAPCSFFFIFFFILYPFYLFYVLSDALRCQFWQGQISFVLFIFFLSSLTWLIWQTRICLVHHSRNLTLHYNPCFCF